MSRAAACTVIVVALCGCWRGSGEPVAEEPVRRVRSKGTSCGEVGAKVEAILTGSGDPVLAARAPPLRGVVERRCSEDAWSSELRRCLTGATTPDEAEACRDLATEPQRAAFEHDLERMVVEDGQ